MMLWERFSKFLNKKIETFVISLRKSYADSVILEPNELFIDSEGDKTCEDIFQNYLTEIPDDSNVRLLLWRLGLAENKTSIHPRTIWWNGLTSLLCFG